MPQVLAEFYATLGTKMPDLEAQFRQSIPDIMADLRVDRREIWISG